MSNPTKLIASIAFTGLLMMQQPAQAENTCTTNECKKCYDRCEEIKKDVNRIFHNQDEMIKKFVAQCRPDCKMVYGPISTNKNMVEPK